MKLKTFPYQAQHSAMPFAVILISVFISFLPNNIEDLLVYQRNLVSEGEFWRLLSGHFLHTNFNHLLLNGFAVVLLWSLHGQYYTTKQYFLAFMLSALTCNIGVHYFSLDINQYVGLSGVLHGIFVWGALLDIKHHDKTGYLLLIGVIAKLAHEQLFGASADVAALISANVAINAHLWGALGGAIIGVISLFRYKNAA